MAPKYNTKRVASPFHLLFTFSITNTQRQITHKSSINNPNEERFKY